MSRMKITIKYKCFKFGSGVYTPSIPRQEETYHSIETVLVEHFQIVLQTGNKTRQIGSNIIQ